jgi:hypothetical protein
MVGSDADSGSSGRKPRAARICKDFVGTNDLPEFQRSILIARSDVGVGAFDGLTECGPETFSVIVWKSPEQIIKRLHRRSRFSTTICAEPLLHDPSAFPRMLSVERAQLFVAASKCAQTIIYVLITFSLVAELPSNNYGKSPLIISSKKCLPESAIAEIGGGRKKPHAHRPKGADIARSSLLRDSGVNLPFMQWIHRLQPASSLRP